MASWGRAVCFQFKEYVHSTFHHLEKKHLATSHTLGTKGKNPREKGSQNDKLNAERPSPIIYTPEIWQLAPES